jgi:type I restriction enzyme, S subunit
VSELPSGWTRALIQEVAEVKLGKMLDKLKNRGEPTPYLRNLNVRWAGFDLTDVALMPMTAIERASLQVRNGDIMVCEGGEPGRAAVWTGGETDLAFQKALMRLRSQCGVEPLYISNYLRHAAGDGTLAQRFTGTTIKHLPQSALSATPLPLPPTAEQQRIVAKLDTLTARTANARAELDRVPALVARYKRALLAAAFAGELVTSARAVDWPVRSVKDLLKRVGAGKNMRCEERPPRADEKGVLKVSAVTWGRFDPSAAKTLPPSFNPPANTQVRQGDLLISRANTLELVGAVVIVGEAPDNLYLSDKVLRLEVDADVKSWLCWFLRSPLGRAAIESSATGNQLSMRNLSQAALGEIELPFPSKEERAEVVAAIERSFVEVERLAAAAVAAHRLLDRLDQAILAKAFRGELVAQNPDDEPASVLLDRIRAERAGSAVPGARGRRRALA